MSGDQTPEPRFLASFGPDPDSASKKYEALRRRLTSFFRYRDCGDPEGLASETLTRGLNQIAKGASIQTDVVRYFHGIAKYVLIEDQKAPKWPASDEADLDAFPARRADTAETRIALSQAIARLPAGEQQLLRRYIKEDRKSLAEELNTTSGHLRLRVYRIRKRLKAMLTLDSEPDGGNK